MLRASPDRLFARFRAHGDAAALARVFDRTAPRLQAVARHLARDAAEAEDLVQATFVTAIQRAASFDPERELMPWLIGILAKEASAARRRAGKHLAFTPGLECVDERERDPAEEAERRELLTAVEAAVADLPPLYRPVLAAYLATGERPTEIALRLGRTPGAVRVQIHRGVALLRKVLPAGFAGAAVVAVPTRGLAAVKQAVLLHAPAYTGASVVGAGGIFGGTTLIMSKNAVLGSCAVLLAIGAAWVAFDGHAPWPGIARPSLEELADGELAAPRVQATPMEERAPAAALEPPLLDERVALDPGARSAAPVPMPATRRSFTLHGTVVDAFAQVALADAEVSVSGRAADGRQVSRSARTTADGRFRLDLDFAPLGFSASFAGYSTNSAFPWRAELTQSLAAGSDFDVGMIELRPGAVVRGRVLSAGGQGLGGADVYLVYHYLGELPAGRPPEGYATWAARSGSDGGFELRGRLAYGGDSHSEYVLVAVSEQGMGWRSLELLHGRGDVAELELRLQAGARLEVTVVDREGRALPGARLRALARFTPFDGVGSPEDGFWPGGGGPLDALTARVTDADGRASFLALPLWQGGAGTTEDAQNPYFVEVRTEAREGGAPWRERLLLGPGNNTHTVIVGALEPRSISGRLHDTDGRPLAGAHVSALDVVAQSFTDGSFRLDGLLEEAPATLVEAELDGWSSARTEVVWNERRLVEDVELELGRPAAVAGRVKDDAGRPVAGARLYLERDAQSSKNTRLEVESDAEGRFAFADAYSGAWYLNAWPPAPSVDGWEGVVTRRVQGGERELVVVLRREPAGVARLVARVVDAASGRALDPEHVRLLPRMAFLIGEVPVAPNPRREAGQVVVDGLRAGRWRLWVRVAEREPAHVDFEVQPDEREVQAVVRVGGSATLVGRVLLEGDADPAHMRVSVMLADWQSAIAVGEEWSTTARHQALVEPARDGSFRVAGLLPGRFVVTLHHYALMAEQELELAPDAETQVVLAPEPGAVLTFSGVVPRSESADGWIFLELEQPSSGWRSGTLWAREENGRFEYRVLAPPGRVEWRATWNSNGELGREPEKESTGALVGGAGTTHAIDVNWQAR